MNRDNHVSLRDFFEFILFIFNFLIFLNVHVST